MRSAIRCLVVSMLLSGCQGKGAAPPSSFQPALLLSDDAIKLDHDLTSTSFNFAYVRDLWVRLKLAGMPHVAWVTLVFVNPHGEEFYNDHQLFSPDPTMDPMPSGQAVYHAKSIAGGYALDRAVPVGGTVFTRYPPTGDWLVKATVEGVPGTLTSPMHVVLAP